MKLYKLNIQNNDSRSGILEKIKSDKIDYEKDFENWLENSPCVLLDDEDTILWIGRQASAIVGNTSKYPDLIGIDSSGDLVIVELKKGRTPREVIAQLLEYAAWGSYLTYEDLNEMAKEYFKYRNDDTGKDLLEVFKEVFYPDDENEFDIVFNKSQRLFIVAEQSTY